ncbi:hypothetical protein AX774_g8119 [Zancudomyces culisetae]|uniref:Uncharacterized protein n=1 Tax=Zancudomyces culisetae TaxID=1213189 RepID=A0A1R1PCB0_ZANCU|nr:hypothetical protein AX774_g8119 [Zancudomyces culisetae]|eukprot:OMH78492.1 hypothetical protein AX774_g8119 [Zancudomyces culisetae]
MLLSPIYLGFFGCIFAKRPLAVFILFVPVVCVSESIVWIIFEFDCRNRRPFSMFLANPLFDNTTYFDFLPLTQLCNQHSPILAIFKYWDNIRIGTMQIAAGHVQCAISCTFHM